MNKTDDTQSLKPSEMEPSAPPAKKYKGKAAAAARRAIFREEDLRAGDTRWDTRTRARRLLLNEHRKTLKMLVKACKVTKHRDITIYQDDLIKLWRRAKLILDVPFNGIDIRTVNNLIVTLTHEEL